ncbi:MAG: hypothetical protein QOE92_888 [Chloroflexota bacterium]|nr:hypothetical protein [Chloroflexota bacterium]
MTPRPAATVAVLRDGPDGLETLLLLRPVEAEFAPRAQVFPGGRIDDADADPAWRELVVLDGADAALAEPDPGAGDHSQLAYVVGAIREVFEETAILLGAQGAMPAGWLADARERVHRSDRAFIDVIRDEGIRLHPSRLAYFARWITPVGLPKRYDTRFFAAATTPGHEAVAAAGEIQSLEWLSPSAALARADTHDAYTLPPTRAALTLLQRYTGVEDAMARLPGDADLTPILPRIVSGTQPGDGEIRVLMPGDPGYDAP